MSFLFIQNEANGTVTEPYATATYDPRRSLVASGRGFDADYSRGRVSTEGSSFTQSKMDMKPASVNDAVVWIHTLFYVRTGSSNGVLYVGGTSVANSSNVKLECGSGAFRITTATGTTIASASLADGTYAGDVMINTGTGEYEIFVDGTSRAKGTSTSLQAVDPSAWDAVQVREITDGNTMSEIIVTEGVITVGMRVISLNPDALAADNTMTGDVSTVNELALNEDGVSTTGAGTGFFGYSDISPNIDMSKYDIAAVNVTTIGTCEPGFVEDGLVNCLRLGGEVHTKLDPYQLNTVSDLTSSNTTFEVNPATGVAFTKDEINAIEAGVLVSAYPDVIITHNELDTSDGLAMGFSDTGRIIGTAELLTAGDTQNIARITVNPSAKTAIIQLDSNAKWNAQSSITVTATDKNGNVASATLPFTTNNYAGNAVDLTDLFVNSQDGRILVSLS